MVYRFRTDAIQSFNIGAGMDKDHGNTITWKVKHEEEPLNLMVAAHASGTAATTNAPGGVPVDLLTVGIPVQFQIKDLRAYATNNVDSGKLLEQLATREVVRYLMGVNLFDVMSTAKAKVAADLQKLIQEQADVLNLGVKIVLVGLEDIHPPQKVAEAFENVIGARQESQAEIHKAHGYTARSVNFAQGEASRLVNEAEAYRFQRVAAAQAQADQFKNQLLAYQAAPDVYKARTYLQPFMNISTNVRFFVKTTTNRNDLFQLDLQEKITADMSDLVIPGKK